MVNPVAESPLVRAERLLAQSSVAALSILERAAEDGSLSNDTRAEALAMIAQHVASQRSERALAEGRAYLARADGLHPSSSVARGRLALVRGYIAYREARDDAALEQLNEAATLLVDVPRQRARVFDVLGMLLSRRGDLDGAHEILTMSAELKRADPDGADPHSLALTYGNLGRLELSRGRFPEAESWLRQDLKIILIHDPKPATEAHVRNQLAQAIEGQGAERAPEVRAELEKARKLTPRGSVTSLYVLKNVALLALREHRADEARRAIDELRESMRERRFPEFEPWMALLEGRFRLSEGASSDKALVHLEEAWKGFVARQMPQEACEAALEWAGALAARSEGRRAIAVLEQARQSLAAPDAERAALTARLDQRLAEIGSDGLLSVFQSRLRRAFGGLSEGLFGGPSPAAGPAQSRPEPPSVVTTCAIELRGFDAFWGQAKDPDGLLARAARIIGALAGAAAERGAVIDRLGPDRVLMHFPGGSAVGRALETVSRASTRLAEVQAEHAHLGEPALSLAAGIAVGWARAHEISLAGQADRPFSGPAVSAACSLVSQADDGETLLDEHARGGLPPALSASAAPVTSRQRAGAPPAFRLVRGG